VKDLKQHEVIFTVQSRELQITRMFLIGRVMLKPFGFVALELYPGQDARWYVVRNSRISFHLGTDLCKELMTHPGMPDTCVSI
jgi:hypothetical protein